MHAQHICRYKKKQDKYKLVYALPFSERLLVSELLKLQSRVPLPKNPVIDGYVVKEKLFQFMNTTKRLDVVTNTGESLSLSISYICGKNGYYINQCYINYDKNTRSLMPLVYYKVKETCGGSHLYRSLCLLT